jgi:L-fuculose-phosphate aldolase
VRDEDYQQQIALCARGLAAYGLGTQIGGHISLRVPGEDTYWTNILNKTLEELRPEDIVKMDFDGKVISGGDVVSPGIDFHQGIYKLRPDVNAIVHTHGFWNTALASMNRPPTMRQNLCTFFYNRCAISPDDTIEAIGPTLKDNVAILIPWHGAITVGNSLGRAAALQVTLEYVAELDVRLTPTGAPPMPEDRCEELRELVESADYLERTWHLMIRKARRAMEGPNGIDPFPVQDIEELIMLTGANG